MKSKKPLRDVRMVPKKISNKQSRKKAGTEVEDIAGRVVRQGGYIGVVLSKDLYPRTFSNKKNNCFGNQPED